MTCLLRYSSGRENQNMHISLHSFMAFLHVLLFVFAIGGDVALYYFGQYLMRAELSLEERLRVRQMRFLVDMSARTALVLLLAVGFTLAQLYGSPIKGTWLVVLWLADLAWLWLVWMVHFKKGTAHGEVLRKTDILIRYLVMAAMIAFGGYCLVTGGPIASRWLAIKILLFAVILMNGVWIRSIASQWKRAFEQAGSGGEQAERGEQMIKSIQTRANKAALLIWVLVVLMAFFGEVKPV